MAILKPFRGYRPPVEIVKDLASRPYDVLSSEEARLIVEGNPYSFLRVVKPEVELPEDINLYSQEVYDKARENFTRFIEKGWLQQDATTNYYVYAQTWRHKTQYGIVGCASVDDYLKGIIKKHELTRPQKEEDRMKHVSITAASAEPVFFTYHAVEEIDRIVQAESANEPVYDFEANDHIRHRLWVIDQQDTIARLEKHFDQVPAFYVADGHHRTAAAALVGQELRRKNPTHTGEENYNFFMAVLFPDNQLTIIDYNRVVKDLNGLSADEFLSRLEKIFKVSRYGPDEISPAGLHNFSMYLEGNWYVLEAREGTYNNNDPIEVLDVTILSRYVLDDILGIKNLRTDQRVEFVGGMRGLGEIKKRVDQGDMAAGFALYPVTMKQLIDIADSGNIMPPKTTWFEPKLRSGLVVYRFGE
jgi:uncharacterized protein (DUF1015 family)